MHQAIVGLPQEEQPPRPREQAILHPRQEDGQGFRQRSYPRLRHGQVPLRSLVLSAIIYSSSWLTHSRLRSISFIIDHCNE